MIEYKDINELCNRILKSKYDSQSGKLSSCEKIQEILYNVINLNVELVKNCDVLTKLETTMNVAKNNKQFEETLSDQLDKQYTLIDEKISQVMQNFDELNSMFESFGMTARIEIPEIDDYEKVIAQTTALTDEMRYQGLDNYKRYEMDLKESFKNYNNQEERDANSAIYKTDRFIQRKIQQIIKDIDPDKSNLYNPEIRTAIGEALQKAGIHNNDFQDSAETETNPIGLSL